MAIYNKLKKINSGGFGIVYKAIRKEDNLRFALKELNAKASSEDIKRFSREVRIQSKLQHENIVSIIAYNLKCDSPFFIMPLAKGNLREYLPKIAGNTEEAIDVFRQILDGIEYAHVNGIIHRDLKPENVLFYPDDIFGDDFMVAKITDFGLGKRLDFESLTITNSHQSIGTAAYMPPEQYTEFKTVDERADIYSLGKILYELLTGDLPIHTDLNHPKVASGFGYIVGKCLEYNPDNRYQTVKELREEFTQLTRKPQLFDKPIEEAERLLASLANRPDDENELKDLDELFRTNASDEAFLTRVFPKLSTSVILSYHNIFKHRFYAIVKTFDAYLSKGLPFSYTDTVADFYERIFPIADSPSIKKLIITRLLVMGCDHNRWYVRDTLCALLTGLDGGSDALLVRDVIKKHPREAAWCAHAVGGGTIPQIIMAAFEECKAICE